MMESISARDLVLQFDSVRNMSTEHLMTGWFSGMDQYVLWMLEAYPQLRTAHANFSQARLGIWPGSLTEESWSTMQTAASELSQLIKEIGDVDILLCERPTQYGACHHALLPDGTCAMNWHNDS
jgi:hypothetical protein